jgi:hypothetical protein
MTTCGMAIRGSNPGMLRGHYLLQHFQSLSKITQPLAGVTVDTEGFTQRVEWPELEIVSGLAVHRAVTFTSRLHRHGSKTQ